MLPVYGRVMSKCLPESLKQEKEGGMQENTMTDTGDVARLKEEIRRLREQLGAQAALLHEIVHDTIVIDRAALAAAGPTLRNVPAGSLRALVRLLEDLGPGGATAQAWTGKSLGDELGLARANHERLIAPLVAAEIIEPAGEPEHKARHYRLHPSLNAHWMRAAALLTRTQRPFRELAMEQGAVTTPSTNAHWMRAHVLSTRTECAQPSLNAHPVRAKVPFVCMYDSESDPDLSESPTNNGWDGTALEIFGAATRGQGLSRDLRAALMARPAADALALVYHARAESTRRPGGLLRRMLEQGIEPAPEYVAQAERKLAPPPDPPQYAHEVVQKKLEGDRSVGLDERPGEGSLTVADIWRATTNQLQLQLNKATYTYIEGALPVRFEDGALYVRTRPGPVVAQTFNRLKEVIDEAMSNIAGVPIAVRYEQ